MADRLAGYSPPGTKLGKWLLEPGRDVPAEIRPILLSGLFGTLVIFLGGVFNTIAVSLLAACRHPTPAFLGWLVYELLLGGARLFLLAHARRNAGPDGRTFTDAYLFLAVAWAVGVGYGSFMALTSTDWVLGGLATISAAAMAGGIAFRNFYAPRLCMIMVVVSFGPAGIAAALSHEHAMWLLVPQVPVYLISLRKAIYGLNAMLVRTIAAERENDRRANHDQLTGLANRAGLERAVSGWDKTRGALAFLYLDLDGFKGINDRLGHSAGDQMLRLVSARLQALAPADGLAARIGGDEFVLIVPEDDRDATLARAEQVIATIADQPYDLGAAFVSVGTSIGIARLPDQGSDVAALMMAADSALYEAKRRGRCRAVIADAPDCDAIVALPQAMRAAAGR